MFTTTARYALVLAFALGLFHFNGASARAEKCGAATPERTGKSLSSLSTGPPVAAGTMRDRALMTNGISVVRFSVARYFTDPDGNDLTYSVSLTGSSVSAEMCGSILKISAISNGNTNVTVTASDGTGDATHSFCVSVDGNCPSVPNNGPVPQGTIADTTFTQNTSPVSFFVSPYFTDPDGDDLTYLSSVSPAGKVDASITDSTLTLTAVSKGSATVTVTATDPSGEDTTQVFEATIANSPPEAKGIIPDTTVVVGDTLIFYVSPYFRDPDPEDRPRLRYLGVSLSRDLASASISDSTLTIAGLSAGSARIAVLAYEVPITEVPRQYFNVTVVEDTTLAVEIIGPTSINSGEENTWEAEASRGTSPYAYHWYYATECVDSAHSPADDSCVWRWISAGTDSSLTQTITTTDTLAGIRVRATDSATPTASSAMDSIIVSVNHAPDTLGTIPDTTLTSASSSVSFDVSPYFEDPDGDTLDYAVSGPSIVTTSITDSTLTITPVSAGTDTVTVTATDPSGLISPAQEFTVTVPAPPVTSNNPPVVDNYIPEQTPSAGGSSVTFNLDHYFSDPDPGDNLTFSASSSKIGTASASVSGSTLTITPLAKGTSQVRVTASDGGASVSQTFTVTITNTSPVVDNDIPDQTLYKGGSAATVNLSTYFSDPDNNPLTYSSGSTDKNIADPSVSGSTLTITPRAKGSATVTVTASDGQASVSQTVTVTIPNRSPVVDNDIPDQTLEQGGEAVTFDLDDYFSDPDGDNLTFSASSSNTAVVRESVSGSTLTILQRDTGSGTVTVTASDGEDSVSQSVTVRVSEDIDF